MARRSVQLQGLEEKYGDVGYICLDEPARGSRRGVGVIVIRIRGGNAVSIDAAELISGLRYVGREEKQ